MKKLIAAAALSAAVALPVAVAPAADAGIICSTTGICGSVKHLDTGRNTTIGVRCEWMNPDTNHWLKRGESDPCKDVDQVYVRAGEEVWSRKTSRGEYYWTKFADATGWHKINDSQNLQLANRSD